MTSSIEDNTFQLFKFSRSVYESAPGFWIPQDIKREMNWTKDCVLWAIIFDASGNRIFDDRLESTSGGEVYLSHTLAQGQEIHVVLFRPIGNSI